MWHNGSIAIYFATPKEIMSVKRASAEYRFKSVPLSFDTLLADVLPASIAQPLAAFGLMTAEDLYECAAAAGATWFRSVVGINAQCATALMAWLRDNGDEVGEVTERFFLPGMMPAPKENPETDSVDDIADIDESIALEDVDFSSLQTFGRRARPKSEFEEFEESWYEDPLSADSDQALAAPSQKPATSPAHSTAVKPTTPKKPVLKGDVVDAAAAAHASDMDDAMEDATARAIVPIDILDVPEVLDGTTGINRAPAVNCSLEANNDLEAIRAWLAARASNENTRGNYRKEAERFLLWCLVERRTALSSIKAGDASLYLRWLEQLGRMDEVTWARTWRVPQHYWIGPKNTPRLSPAWRPFNGPLMSTSRHNAIVVVRQLFNFLKKTGYLIFNPFDQVSPKVPLLKGEGAPQAFADRSLTDEQWQEIVSHIHLLPEGWPRERMKLILMMGKSLGMRASEMVEAKASWLVERRLGRGTRLAIEVVGKGAKVRRLPLNSEQIHIIEGALAARGFPSIEQTPPDEPLLINLGRGRNANASLTRAGLYGALAKFFDTVANDIAIERPMDAAKLRAASTHWLRHTFAVTALSKMSVNVVQHAMGHASVATTGRYLAPEEETLTEAMDQLKAL